MLLCLSSTLFAEALPEVMDKNIGIRPAVQNNFDVTISSDKKTYRVGERINLMVKGNSHFYLYLFAKNQDKDKKGYAISILPNKYQKDQHYNANIKYNVLKGDIEYFSDRKGTEHLIMVATTKPFNVREWLRKKANNVKSMDNFYEFKDVNKSINKLINKTYNKNIQIRSSSDRLPTGVVLKILTLNIMN